MSESIITEIIQESRRDEWDNYLDKRDAAIAWQRYGWHDILQKPHPHDFLPLAAFRNNGICGVLPLYKLHDRLHLNKFFSVPFAVAGGIVADSKDVEKALLEKALLLAKQHAVTSLVLKQYKHKIDGDLRVDDTYFNRELSLTQGVDLIWQKLDQKNRAMITAAKNDNLTLEHPTNRVGEFYSLLFSFHHRQGLPCDGKRWIEDLVSSGMYTCAIVRRKDKIIAGTLVKSFKKTISFPFTCLHKIERSNDMAAYWLYWELINLYAGQGFEISHSGRIPADESVPAFRLGWGGTKFPYFYQYFPATVFSSESSRKRGGKRRVFGHLWRLLPKPVVIILSPYVIRRFP